MKPLPSRIKIALLSAGLSGLVLVVFGVFAWMTFYQVRLAAMDREIRSLTTRHPGLFLGRGSYERLASSLEFTFGEDYTNKVIMLLKDAENRTVYISPHWPEEIDPNSLDALFPEASAATHIAGETNALADSRFSEQGGMGRGRGFGRGGPPPARPFSSPPRFYTTRADGNAWRMGLLANEEIKLALGLNLQEVQVEMGRVRNAFLLSVPLALLFIGLGGWIIAGRTLRPLSDIAETAEKVTAQGLDQRIPESHANPEMRRVITVLNRMMDRLEASFRQATRFSADASHELKTPLAIMQSELEIALQAAAPGSPQQRLCSNLMEDVQRLKTITRSLLLLAQADAGRLKLALEKVNLSAELETLLEDARVLAADKKLSFEVSLPADIHVQADRALMRTPVFNLLNNAVKYSDVEGRIEVKLSASAKEVSLETANSGPGIPPEEQSKIFNRFHRVRRPGDPQTDGMGLGLNLAREIARAHGGEVKLLESGPGQTCFLLTLGTPKE